MTDTAHEAITVTEKPDFNLSQLGLSRKTAFVCYTNEAFQILNNIEKIIPKYGLVAKKSQYRKSNIRQGKTYEKTGLLCTTGQLPIGWYKGFNKPKGAENAPHVFQDILLNLYHSQAYFEEKYFS